jgi:hypothetical protein
MVLPSAAKCSFHRRLSLRTAGRFLSGFGDLFENLIPLSGTAATALLEKLEKLLLECATAAEHPAECRIYRVHLFAKSPRISTLAPPLEAVLKLTTETWRASF